MSSSDSSSQTSVMGPVSEIEELELPAGTVTLLRRFFRARQGQALLAAPYKRVKGQRGRPRVPKEVSNEIKELVSLEEALAEQLKPLLDAASITFMVGEDGQEVMAEAKGTLAEDVEDGLTKDDLVRASGCREGDVLMVNGLEGFAVAFSGGTVPKVEAPVESTQPTEPAIGSDAGAGTEVDKEAGSDREAATEAPNSDKGNEGGENA